jgi:hypothetical protein
MQEGRLLLSRDAVDEASVTLSLLPPSSESMLVAASPVLPAAVVLASVPVFFDIFPDINADDVGRPGEGPLHDGGLGLRNGYGCTEQFMDSYIDQALFKLIDKL